MHRPIPLTGRLTWRQDLLLPFPSGLLPRPTPTAIASLRAGGDGTHQPTGAPARRRTSASPWPRWGPTESIAETLPHGPRRAKGESPWRSRTRDQGLRLRETAVKTGGVAGSGAGGASPPRRAAD
jgi:hypothetical protein